MNSKKYFSILIILAILASSIFSTYADESYKTVMELRIGSSQGSVNGIISQVEAPYIADEKIMVPLEWFAAAIGAEVDKISGDKIKIIYRDDTEEVTIGKTDYTSNYESKSLSAPPAAKNSSTMLPLDFISSSFPVTVTSDITGGSIKIVLEDDGALNDLSFLTGGISSPKVGDSYYGWSLSVPSGSRIITNSYNSDKIGITNESRGLYFEISIENKNDRNLSGVYEDLMAEKSFSESSINLKASVPYFQYATTSVYGEAVRCKVFEKGDYFYYLTINCYDGTTTTKQLMTDKFYNSIIDSFNLNYKGNVKGVQDLTKVKNGEVKYYNYITLNSDVKYLPWTMDIPAKWDAAVTSDHLTTKIGMGGKNYIKVTINNIGNTASLDEYVKGIKDHYDKFFSPKAYTFISSSKCKVGDTQAKNLKFRIKQAGKSYIIDEFYFIKGKLVYEISVKIPEKDYNQVKSEYLNAINSMSFYSTDEDKLVKDMDKYRTANEDSRISENDKPVDYTNKTYNWSMKVPGYWEKLSYYDLQVVLQNPNSNAYVSVSAFDETANSKNIPDEIKFDSLGIIKFNEDCKLIKSNKTKEKGLEIKNYTYQIQNEEADVFGVAEYHVFTSGKTSYCYMSFLPDLTATDAALKELGDIWKSFKITKKR